jgi:pyruvate formate lyase activating enzyme
MNLDNMVVAINRLSESDQDQFWPVVFLGGCNLRCQYCLNTSIVAEKLNPIPIDSVLTKLNDWQEDGVVVSGGEPLLLDRLGSTIALLRKLAEGGRKVGLATNGTYPVALKELLKQPGLLSFVSLDCKFSPLVSQEEAVRRSAYLCGYDGVEKDMLKSLCTVFDWHTIDQNAKSEIKLTLYPPIVGEDDVVTIAKLIHRNSKFVLQQYRQNIMFDGASNAVEPYSTDEVERLKVLAVKSCQAMVEVRWP